MTRCSVVGRYRTNVSKESAASIIMIENVTTSNLNAYPFAHTKYGLMRYLIIGDAGNHIHNGTTFPSFA
jgi:hypothetical protein